MNQFISIKGAKTHNLKNIDVDIPRNKLVVITGISGSGKSSLAFDTIYAEGQRRYVESLSAYARQFLSLMEKPDVELIEGLSPAISIEQKTTLHNPRSTVGTITEIYDYLRLLFARIGTPKCPEHNLILEAKTISQMIDEVSKLPSDEKIMVLAPLVQHRKGEYKKLLGELKAQGFLRVKIDKEIIYLDNDINLDAKKYHDINVVIDRLKVRADINERLAQSLETALDLSGGIVQIAGMEDESINLVFSAKFSCPNCGYSLEELEPRLFSFNSPTGACPSCDGLGVRDIFDVKKVVANPKLSLEEGAIYGWGRANGYFFQMLDCVAKCCGFDTSIPFQDLSEKAKNIVLYGSGEQKIPCMRKSMHGLTKSNKPFIGIIAHMQQRYDNSDVHLVNEQLARYISSQDCKDCNGQRLNIRARNVLVGQNNISQLTRYSIYELQQFFNDLALSDKQAQIAQKILKEITRRLSFLLNVGLEYLSLERRASTLSGGEAQRIRLASQIGAGLTGVLYVLDEPSIGLHQRDNQRLLSTLSYLRDLGNTVIVVEHDQEAIELADFVLDIGRGAGKNGGRVVAQGTPTEIAGNTKSLTGDYLSGRLNISVPKKRKKAKGYLQIKGASGNNLKNINFKLPLGVLTCITGVSGSGKSTLINNTLYPITANKLNRAQLSNAPYKEVIGLKKLDKVVNIDQSPIGRTPRSNPATYTGIFTLIRDLFALTEQSRARGYRAGRFSFNVQGGRCEACKGDGLIKVEMHFLADIYVKCDVCVGKRYNRESLEILYKGKNIAEVLAMTVYEASVFFKPIPKIYQKLTTLVEVGLSYIALGQNAVTLSGGEAQRVKLAKELSKSDTGHTLYILDEPTTGLHFDDVSQLLKVIQSLRDRGNTIVIIEHNLDVIKTADWVIDLGPEGGYGGGEIIACGTPELLTKNNTSYTGQFLAKLGKV